ncbi:hypothetical protein V6N13_043161 [Hibiscus sabdariffa]
MFEFRLRRASLLKKVLQSIKDLVINANFDCSATGFSLLALDSNNIAVVALLLRSDGFEYYRCDRNISLGMNLANMATMLRGAFDDDIVTVKADDGAATVTFTFDSPSQDKISDYEMGLMEIESERLEIPETEHKAIVIGCQHLIVITVTKDELQFFTNGDIGTAKITCRKTTPALLKEEEAISIEMEKPISQTFGLRYLTLFTKATPLSKQVTISMLPESPIAVEYTMENMGYIRFYLAPRPVEEEEEEEEVAGPEPGPSETEPKVDSKAQEDAKPEMEIPAIGEEVKVEHEGLNGFHHHA